MSSKQNLISNTDHAITPKHRYPLMILENHLDLFGHVNNAVYLRILEEARWDLITKNGYGVKEIRETGIGPVILETHILFRREILLRQEVVIETWFATFEKRLAVIRQHIVDESGKVYCEAEFKFGLFDTRNRRLVKPTPMWLKALGIPEHLHNAKLA